MALVGFDQDPEAQPGMGLFRFDDGQSIYAHNPEAAASIAPPPPAPVPDQRLALNADEALLGGDPRFAAGAGGAAPAMSPSVADVGPNMTAPPADYYQSAAPAPNASPAPMVSQGQAQGMGSGSFDSVPTAQPAQRTVPMQPSPLVMTRGGRVLPTGKTTERTSGMPVTEQDIQANWGLFEDRMLAKEQALGVIAAKQDAAMAQAAKQQSDYLRAHQFAAEEQDNILNRRVDPDRYFKDRGLAAGIGMAIAQGMMAYGAAITHVQNPAIQWVQNAIDRDISAQQEDYRRDGIRAQNQLTEIMQRYQVDSERAGAVLKNLQASVAGVIGQDYAHATGSKEMASAWQAYLAEETAKANASNVKLLSDAFGQQKDVTTSRVTQPGVTLNPMLKAQLALRKEIAETQKAENNTGGYMGTVFADENSYREAALEAVRTGKAPDIATFTRDAQLKGGGAGGGGEPASLTRQRARTDTVQQSTQMAAELTGARPGMGFFEAKAKQVSNWIGAAFGGSDAAAMQAAQLAAKGEIAVLLDMGHAAESTKQEVHDLLNTNDPRKWEAARIIVTRVARQEEEAIKKAVATRKGGGSAADDIEMGTR